MLDVGCGRGFVLPFPWRQYPEVELVGIDPDPTAAGNPCLDSFVLMTRSDEWKLASESFDLVIARYVLEHVNEPGAFLSQVARVLRKGARALFLAPHLRSPVMFLAYVMPLCLKRALLARDGKRAPQDVFPTFYRLNTGRQIRRWAAESKLTVERLLIDEFMPMEYLDVLSLPLSRPWFWVIQHSRLNRIIGASILVTLRKE